MSGGADAFSEMVFETYRALLRDGFCSGEGDAEYRGAPGDDATYRMWERGSLSRWVREIDVLAESDGLLVEHFTEFGGAMLLSVGVDNVYPVALLRRPDGSCYSGSERLPPRYSDRKLREWRARIENDWGETLAAARRRGQV